MTAYREIELSCDGTPGDPFGCWPAIHHRTATQARQEARRRFGHWGKRAGEGSE